MALGQASTPAALPPSTAGADWSDPTAASQVDSPTQSAEDRQAAEPSGDQLAAGSGTPPQRGTDAGSSSTTNADASDSPAEAAPNSEALAVGTSDELEQLAVEVDLPDREQIVAAATSNVGQEKVSGTVSENGS